MIPIDSQYDPLAWGSHLAPLMACLGASRGSVLELGVGHFSTPILHAYCIVAKRVLISVEDNLEWFDGFRQKYECDGHQFIREDYAAIVPELARTKQFGVAFIDNSPGGQRRLDDFVSLIPVSDFVVVHDYHGENEDAIGPRLKALSYAKCTEYMPPTLIASRWDLPETFKFVTK